ncbi:MAG TPA: polyhydroxyalkanoate synthesis repressor PhaR [Alphaproteobacteria bacterium]|nr:polyhydroxyalkanoate synthesis repressor PhaR [Alphaproteobacteria bacterium]
MADEKDKKSGPITIKKYANRRLYNTGTSSYVTLDDLCQMVKTGTEFVVYDAKTGEDITRSVLTQIIFEEESKGQNMLPIAFLRQLIGFYGDSMQWALPKYLELTMDAFSANRDKMRDHMKDAFGSNVAVNQFESLVRQNISMFENALRMFSPFGAAGSGQTAEQPTQKPADQPEAKSDDEMKEMRRQIAEMQKALERLTKEK